MYVAISVDLGPGNFLHKIYFQTYKKLQSIHRQKYFQMVCFTYLYFTYFEIPEILA